MKLNAIKVQQPLGDFYITKIKAGDLLNIAYTEEFRYKKDGTQEGTQRPTDEKRLKEISNYIKSEEMCFPSSILIALNRNPDNLNNSYEDDDNDAFIIHCIESDLYEITIPETKKCALIIDGQHRLKAFNYVDSELKDIELVCSIFFDLPNPYQAYLFATINGNQKKVDKSLALEFFGYNVEDEPSDQWTPEKLAVFLTRKLNFRTDSPLYHQLKLAASYDDNEKDKKLASTAAMAEGILSLISNNPKRDRDIISATRYSLFKKKTRQIVADQKDSSPLRDLFLNNRDEEIYNIIVRYFSVVKEFVWDQANDNSIIKKTIGVLALFDLLKNIIKRNRKDILDPSSRLFDAYIHSFEFVDFSDNYFSTSGLGQGRIKRIIKYLSQITHIESLKDEDVVFLQNCRNGYFILLRFVRRIAYQYTDNYYDKFPTTISAVLENRDLKILDIESSVPNIIEGLYRVVNQDNIVKEIFGSQYDDEESFYDMLYRYTNYSDLESECINGILSAVKNKFGNQYTALYPSNR